MLWANSLCHKELTPLIRTTRKLAFN
jgi:hypothetical protein